MRRTSTDKNANRHTNRRKNRAIHLAASALAVTASLAGTTALADHKGYDGRHSDHGYHKQRDYRQDSYRYGPIYWKRQQTVRVHIPVRDHGPEILPLGRLITQNSNVDLNRYRLQAVETTNGRFSNGFASLRTGNSKTERYFLGSRQVTHIPAPSSADSSWRLRLGPGTQVRSITAVLEPRHDRGYRNRRHASVHHDSTYSRGKQTVHNTPGLSLAWLLANNNDDDRDYKRDHKRNHKQDKRVHKLRAEELAHEQVEDRKGKRGKADDDRRRSGKGKRHSEREVKRTVRYVVSAN